MYELVYTSTPQGLITGRSGFTTVALTEGFPPNLIAPVENLSGYKPLYASGDANENRNPENYSCQHFRLGRTNYIVLSKIAYAGLSYTGRSNVLAHHLLFLPEELDEIPGGAISVLRAEENFPPWSGEPRMLPQKRKVAYRPLPQGGDMWQKLAGDARWKKYTTACFSSNPDNGFALAFDPLKISGTDILDLIAETAAGMNKQELRQFTFSTYSYLSAISNPAFIRSYVKDSTQLASIKRLEPKSVINLGEMNVLPETWSEPAASPEPVILYSDEPQDVTPQTDQELELMQSNPSQEETYKVNLAGVRTAASRNDHANGSEERRAEKDKRLLIMIPVVFILLFLCGTVFWRIFSGGTQTQANNNTSGNEITGHPVVKAQTKAKTKTPPAPPAQEKILIFDEPEAAPAVLPPVRKKKTSPPVSVRPVRKENPVPPEPRVRTLPVGEAVPVKKVVRKPAVRKPKKVTAPRADFGKLSPQEIYKLYLSLYRGTDYKLPWTLRDAAALELKIHSIGGRSDISSPKSFISGNGSRKIIVYSRRSVRSDALMMEEWQPDKMSSGQMRFQLMSNGVLRIRFPEIMNDRTPVTADITRITFVQRGGKKVSFTVNKLPLCIDKILNRNKKVLVENTGRDIRLVMDVPDDLWTFRRFYDIAVDGRNLGGINTRKIILRELDLRYLVRSVEKRNSGLLQYQAAVKREQDYRNKYAIELQKPELPNRDKLRKYLPANIFEALKVDIIKEDDNAWNKQLAIVTRTLELQVEQQMIKKAESDKLIASLKDYRTRYFAHNEYRQQLDRLQQNMKSLQAKAQQANKILISDMKRISPVFYRATAGYLLEYKILPVDFYKYIKHNELVKDIKVEIIRKGH